jgi:hypothetical protein
MNRKKAILILTSIFLLLVLVMPGYCSEKPTCAVLLFHPDMSASNIYESQMLSNKYAELIDRLDMFDVIDYNEVAEILKSKNALDLEKTCTDLGCALKIGNKLNTDFVIYGIIGNVGNLFSLDTTLVNVAGGNETQHAVFDFEGTQADFAKNAPAENLKSLFGINEIPAATVTANLPTPVAVANVTESQSPDVAEEPAPMVTDQHKQLRFGPRVGIGASNDGLYLGGGFEVQVKKLSFQFLLNEDGFASGLSFYLHPEGSSPFASVVGSYYDTKHKGATEIGRIYGILLGYRLAFDKFIKKDFARKIDTRIGLGVGYVNWDQTKVKDNLDKLSDEEFIPIFEWTLGYMF